MDEGADLDDVEAMVAAAARPGAKAVVIGGGLLGIEAAYGLVRRGMAATVIHLMDVLMERQLDASAGFLLVEAMARRIAKEPPLSGTHEQWKATIEIWLDSAVETMDEAAEKNAQVLNSLHQMK